MTETTDSGALLGKTATGETAEKDTITTKQGVDVLAQVAHEVENLDYDKAAEIIGSTDGETRLAQFRMGGALALIQRQGWWKEKQDGAGNNYERFAVYVEDTFGFSYRKARNHIEIYEKLLEIGVDFDSIAAVGWSKFLVLLPILDKENWKQWHKRATVIGRRALEEEVRAARAGTLDGAGTKPTATFKSKSFGIALDDVEVVETAIEAAMLESETEHSGTALVNICTAYNAGNLKAAPAKEAPTLPEVIATHGWEAVLQAVVEAHPELDINVEIADGEEAA